MNTAVQCSQCDNIHVAYYDVHLYMYNQAPEFIKQRKESEKLRKRPTRSENSLSS